jgi:hypothetical protein
VNGNTAKWAVLGLVAVAFMGIIGGVAVSYFGGDSVGAVVAIATGAVGGIVAIVLKMMDFLDKEAHERKEHDDS